METIDSKNKDLPVFELVGFEITKIVLASEPLFGIPFIQIPDKGTNKKQPKRKWKQ